MIRVLKLPLEETQRSTLNPINNWHERTPTPRGQCKYSWTDNRWRTFRNQWLQNDRELSFGTCSTRSWWGIQPQPIATPARLWSYHRNDGYHRIPDHEPFVDTSPHFSYPMWQNTLNHRLYLCPLPLQWVSWQQRHNTSQSKLNIDNGIPITIIITILESSL